MNLKDPGSDPVTVFDDLWKFMDERYAMFSVKGVDWKKTNDQFRSQIRENMSDQELFDVLQSMLATLQDGHVSLVSPFDTAVYIDFYRGFPINFNYNNLLNNYLLNDYKTSGPVLYKIVSNTGYLYYGSFRTDISDAEVTTIFDEMKSTKGMIIDIRNNTGGKLENVNKIFNRFIGSKRLIKYEMRKSGPGHDQFFDPQPYYIEPAGQEYKSPVVMLTNRSCFSVCNDFVMYMSQLPNVKLMGDRTGGGGGLPQNYVLPNGWKLQYTASVTLTPAKTHIENGILPTLRIDITPQDILNGKDPIIETAFQSLQ